MSLSVAEVPSTPEMPSPSQDDGRVSFLMSYILADLYAEQGATEDALRTLNENAGVYTVFLAAPAGSREPP